MFTVAIDGPAGAGKSTVARGVAQALGITYLDTGAMYRAVAVIAKREDRNPVEVAQTIRLQLGERVIANDVDVTDFLRNLETSQEASRISALPDVRAALVALQQKLMADGEYVAEGRDIGTVVAPNAQVKIFLTASVAERARRRAAMLGVPVEDVLAEQEERDSRDSSREHSPLKAADDAVILDATEYDVETVIAQVCGLAYDAGWPQS